MSTVLCAKCGRRSATARELHEYHYKESGLPNVWLLGGVTETRCSECHETFVQVWKESQLLQVIAVGLLMRPASLTGAELRFLRRACGLSQGGLAEVLRCPRRATVADREGRKNPGLSFPEELGVRAILLKAFQAYLSTPGNNFLEPTQLQDLWRFASGFHQLAMKVQSEHRIKAAVQQELWILKPQKRAA